MIRWYLSRALAKLSEIVLLTVALNCRMLMELQTWASSSAVLPCLSRYDIIAKRFETPGRWSGSYDKPVTISVNASLILSLMTSGLSSIWIRERKSWWDFDILRRGSLSDMTRFADAGNSQERPNQRRQIFWRTQDNLWLHKNVPMNSIESIGALSCKLQMLYLVLSYRNMGSAGKISEEKLSE